MTIRLFDCVSSNKDHDISSSFITARLKIRKGLRGTVMKVNLANCLVMWDEDIWSEPTPIILNISSKTSMTTKRHIWSSLEDLEVESSFLDRLNVKLLILSRCVQKT